MYAGKSTDTCRCPTFVKCRADEAAKATWLEVNGITPTVSALKILKADRCGKTEMEQLFCQIRTKILWRQADEKEEAQWKSLGTNLWNRKYLRL